MPASKVDGQSGNSGPVRSDQLRLFFRKYATVIGLLLLVIMFEALKPTVFLTLQNMRNVLVAVASLGVVAAGQTVVFALNDFDMSQGSVASMVGIMTGVMMVNQHLSWPLAVLVGLGIGCAAGAFNGFMVAYVNLAAFIATLGTMTAFQGVALLYYHGNIITGLPSGYLAMGQNNIGPIPYLVIIFAGVSLIAFVVMERTSLGRRWYATGGNYDASYLAGLQVRKLRFLAFVVSGAGAALGGMMLAARLAQDTPTMGAALTLNVVAAVFLGMTAFKECLPNMAGTVVGALFLGVLINGLAINYVNSFVQEIITGGVVIGSVALAGLMKKDRA